MAEIEVQQADITKLEVDAIANAANTDLKHGGGVAGAIVRAGGRIVQDESDELAPIGLGEAVATSAGEMPARCVIHAATMLPVGVRGIRDRVDLELRDIRLLNLDLRQEALLLGVSCQEIRRQRGLAIAGTGCRLE